MDFKSIFVTNWKTTTAALVALGLSVLHMAGVNVSGYVDPGFAAALSAAVGLFFAKDATAK